MNEVESSVDAAVELIKKAVELLEDEDQKTYFTKVTKSVENASSLVDGDEEKAARLEDAAVKFANQIMFILYRADKLTDELTAEFRALPSAEFTGDQVKIHEAARQDRIDEINEAHQEIIDEQKELDIFTAVIGGMSKEEAEKKMAEYEAQVNGR